jgi:cyclopropane-fatty-acyl-phospholipid synthase
MLSLPLALAERGWLPESIVRWGIRRLLAQRLREIARPAPSFDTELSQGPIALVPDAANRQHYELPADFFQLVLGSHLKYSSAFWSDEVVSLDEAELVMLEVTGSRAQLADGQRVLELGCGWGSLSLWMANRYPNSQIVAVSNSATQREFIMARAPANLEVITADINDFRLESRFDRVVSVEMFEHMHNWRELVHRIAGWLEPGGKLFVHVFCHRRFAYRFETAGAGNWLGRYFFTGGLMPSLDLLPRFQAPFVLEKTWVVDGSHYARTAEAWATNLMQRRMEVLRTLTAPYGADAPVWLHRWHIFFLACAELFGYRDGSEWLVGHYRLRKP